MAGGFLAVGSFMSGAHQEPAHRVPHRRCCICFLLLDRRLSGRPPTGSSRWAPQWLVDGIASLSFLTHFENIIKGVLDLRDLLYFALVTIFFLLASTVVLDARKSKYGPDVKKDSNLSAPPASPSSACCSSPSCCWRTCCCAARKLDLTADKLYTISDGTENIVHGLKEPVNLYLFFSEKTATPIPQIRNHGMRVRELLEELVSRSNGKLTLKVIDPQPFSEEEDRANELGVTLGADQRQRRQALSRPRRHQLHRRQGSRSPSSIRSPRSSSSTTSPS